MICPVTATLTDRSQAKTLRGRANKQNQVHKPQTKEKQSNQFPFPQPDDHNTRQDALEHNNSPVASSHKARQRTNIRPSVLERPLLHKSVTRY